MTTSKMVHLNKPQRYSLAPTESGSLIGVYMPEQSSINNIVTAGACNWLTVGCSFELGAVTHSAMPSSAIHHINNLNTTLHNSSVMVCQCY